MVTGRTFFKGSASHGALRAISARSSGSAHQLGCRFGEKPHTVALVALGPVVELRVDRQCIDPDQAADVPLLLQPLVVAVAADRHLRDADEDAGLIGLAPGGGMRQLAGGKPTLRQHPSLRLPRCDEKHKRIAAGGDGERQRRTLAPTGPSPTLRRGETIAVGRSAAPASTGVASRSCR
jgi:hypothetical protein